MLESEEYLRQRAEMIEQQLRRRGITDERVLAAMLEIPRQEFVPIELRVVSYRDEPISIGDDGSAAARICFRGAAFARVR